MKRSYIHDLYPALCLLAVFQSCESDVNFTGGESVPKMVVNSIINTEAEKLVLKLSESVFAFGSQTQKPVERAELQLTVNGNEVELTFEETKGLHRYYGFPANLSPGDKVEIRGKSPRHDDVYGMDHVPEPADITGIKTEWFTGKTDNRSYLRILITLKDTPREKNYYRVVIRVKNIYEFNGDYDPDWLRYDAHVDQEPLFNYMPNTPWDETPHRYRVFSDEMIDGKEYTLNIYVQMDKENLWGANPRTFIKAEIHTLSENLYRYLRSVELAGNGDNFTEPVKIFSNISGGYGVLGIYNINDKIIEIER